MYSAACKAYLEDCAVRMQPNTIIRKMRHLKRLASDAGADFPLLKLTVDDVRRHLASVQNTYGSKVANEALKELKALWNWHRVHNPWREIYPYPEDEPAKYVPPPEDVAAVLLVATGFQRDFLALMIRTAARESELLRLTWDDVSLENRAIRLWTRKRKGGGKQSRVLPLSNEALDIMSRRWKARPKDAPGYVFVNPQTGTAYTRLQHPIRYMLLRLCRMAGVRQFGFHSLRHYTSQRLMDSGKATLREIQTILGHQRATTTDVYLRSLSPDLKHMADILDEVVTPQDFPKSGNEVRQRGGEK